MKILDDFVREQIKRKLYLKQPITFGEAITKVLKNPDIRPEVKEIIKNALKD